MNTVYIVHEVIKDMHKPQNKCNIIEYKQHILDETFAVHIYLNRIRTMFPSFDVIFHICILHGYIWNVVIFVFLSMDEESIALKKYR